MHSSADGVRERRRRKREARDRLQAIASFLIRSERRGFRVSPHAQYVLENECLEVFKDYDGPPDTFQFATMLRETAVRMFRQGRYKEANQRYRMASLFNPFDATLLSNRATCLYNLRRYRRCIDICQICFSAFPNLFCPENTGLYFQVLILLANSHIKLRSFREAMDVYEVLIGVKEKLRSQKDTRVSMTEAANKLLRFEIDLKIARQSPHNPVDDPALHKERPVRPADFPFQEDRGHFLHPHTPSCYLREINTGIDDYDLNAEEDGDPALVITVGHLCHHVYHMGMGACGHEDGVDVLWQNDSDSCSAQDDDGDSEESFYFVEDTVYYDESGSDEDSKTECACVHNQSEATDLATVTRERLPSDNDKKFLTWRQDLRCDEFGLIESAPFDREGLPNVHRNTSLDSRSNSQVNAEMGSSDNSAPRSPPTEFSRDPKSSRLKDRELLSMDDAVESLRLARYSDNAPCSPSEKETENNLDYGKLVTELLLFMSRTQRSLKSSPKRIRLFHDSDSEEPISRLDFSYVPENDDWDLFEKAFKRLPSGNDTFLSRCTTQLFGSSFQSSGALDFTRYFGSHVRIKTEGGKKKSKSCVGNCPPCFARRMWKLRFKSHKAGDAEQFFLSAYNDERRDDKSFLSLHEWRCSDNYGSGYELATEHGILVHGVAYLILLQNEVCWQQNEVGIVKSIQRPFSAALLKNMKTRTDLMAISTLRDVLLETLYLMRCIKYQAWKNVPPSHQFVRTPEIVSEMASVAPDLSEFSSKEQETRLMSQNGTAMENMSKWAAVGHLAKEEEWVYHTLSRDVRDVILHFERKALSIVPAPMPPILNTVEGGMTQSSGLEHILYGQRSRELESRSKSRKKVDLERGEILLTRALEAFPLKLRLYYKRADVRYQMKKWDACIRDLKKLQSLARKRKEDRKKHSLGSEQEKILLYHVLLLKADAHGARAQKVSSARKSHILASIDLYKRAMNMYAKKKRNRTKILQKVRKQEHLLVSLETSKNARRKEIKPATKKSEGEQNLSVVKQVVRRRQSSPASSSEDEEEILVPGSRYGALLEDSTSTHSSPQQRPNAFQVPSSGTILRAADNGVNRTRGDRARSNNEPSPETVLIEVRRILLLFGGEARSSDVVANLDLTGWNIHDSGEFITRTFKALHSLCREYGTGFEIRAGSHSDPVIAVTSGEDFTLVSRGGSCSSSRKGSERPPRYRPTRHGNSSRSRSSTLVQPESQIGLPIRTSEAFDYANIIENLLKEKNVAQNPSQAMVRSRTDREKECCICMDNPSDSLTIPCRHPFCENCILNYLTREKSDKKCPVCRCEVINVASMVVHNDTGNGLEL
ncbi:unnamed protein product [Agarophyton chilense]|eukprot:gb/GEZJ01000255.1/.p1 GENE.gb/GEZJ01000255.1/~~gb/GEZJ01000255.1/.p1  ORF type:complete len:1332 (+),score=166.45 gb/GEZJ01000255.1/:204-4199(+)